MANPAVTDDSLVLGRDACAYDLTGVSLIGESIDEDDTSHAYGELRTARRRNRIATVDKFDVFYKAYVTAIFASLGMYFAIGAIGDAPVSTSTVETIARIAPQWLGLGVAVAIAVGLRSGGRGGPLGFELADVRHVILAPVDRHETIRHPARRYLLHALFLGMCAGAAAGLIGARRLPHHFLLWVVSCVVFCVAVAALATGVAMMASGLRLPRWACDLLGVGVVAWSCVDIWQETVTSPATWLGTIPIAPLELSVWSIVGVVVAVVGALGGIACSNRVSIEALERRSRLVGQLRFAATMQDLRTVMVLQRQLSLEQMRQRRFFQRRPVAPAAGDKLIQFRERDERVTVFSPAFVIRRSWRGLTRWSLTRLVRAILLVGLSVAALIGGWLGTSPLFIVAALCMWILALDLVEPLAQEVDRPDRLALSPMQTGRVLSTMLLTPLAIVFMVAQGVFFALRGSLHHQVAGALWPVTVVLSMCVVGGAAIVVARRPGSSGAMETPEVAGIKMLWRSGSPIFVAAMGFLPIYAARQSWFTHHDAARVAIDMNTAFLAAMAVGFFAVGYVRYANEFRGALDKTAKEQQEKARIAKEEAEKKRESRRQSKSAPAEHAPAKKPLPANQRKNKKKGKKR